MKLHFLFNTFTQVLRTRLVIASMTGVLVLGAIPLPAFAAVVNGCDSSKGDYCGGGDAPAGAEGAAAGVGSCGAGLLASALGALGISKAVSVAGEALTTGATVAAIDPLAVPTVDRGALVQRKGEVAPETVTAISNNAILGIDVTNLNITGTLDCTTRAIARAILQHVTTSVVNWARSGFTGTPTFVSNPTQFFTSVADSAAGAYLQSSDLAFLCSPFSLQVKIAIAQSYNGSNNSGLQCTLTGVASNIQRFMGNFSEGGWPAFISMTTNPANQPFGAYTQAQSGLNAAVAQSVSLKQKQLDLSGGFLDMEEYRNCKVVGATEASAFSPDKHKEAIYDSAGKWIQTKICDVTTVTPGKIIESSLSKVIGTNIDSLNAAKHFDEIISALITGLMQKVVIGAGGLLGTGSAYGSVGDFGGGVDSIAFLGNQVTDQIPGIIANEQTLMNTYNQDIADIRPALANASATLSCWQSLSPTDPSVSSGLQAAQLSVDLMNFSLTRYQDAYDTAAAAVTTLQKYQTDIGSLSSNDLQALSNLVIEFTNTGFADTASITGAYEDRVGLLSTLATHNTDSANGLTDCKGKGGTVGGPTPTTTFSASPTSGAAPFSTTFQVLNASSVNGYSVNNGDGTQTVPTALVGNGNCTGSSSDCTLRSTHTYITPGAYTATLTHSFDGGTNGQIGIETLGTVAITATP